MGNTADGAVGVFEGEAARALAGWITQGAGADHAPRTGALSRSTTVPLPVWVTGQASQWQRSPRLAGLKLALSC